MSDRKPDYSESLRQRIGLERFEEYLRFPRYFEIETVNRCNAACTMCTVKKWNRRDRSAGLMGDAVWAKLAAELIEHRDLVRIANLSRDGEPLLDPKLEERIADLKQGGIATVKFSTNVALLDEKRARALLATPLDEVMLSIDSMRKEVFERIRVGLRFETVIENAERFIRLRDELSPGLRIRVRMVVMKENEDEVEEWARFWTERVGPNDQVHSREVHSWGNQVEGYAPVREMDLLRTPCTSPFSTMVIKANGDVTVCPIDCEARYVNGNIGERGIAEIWREGVGLRLFREKHLAGERNDLPYCPGCYLWEPVIRTDHQ